MDKYENPQLLSFKNEETTSYSISNTDNTIPQSLDASSINKSKSDIVDNDKDINVESFAEFVKSIEKVLSKNDILESKSCQNQKPIDINANAEQNTNHFRGNSFGIEPMRVIGHPPMKSDRCDKMEVINMNRPLL